jgi:hypothetical protein
MLTKKQDKNYNADVSSFDIIASIILISLGIILFSYCIFSFIMFNEIINMNVITYPSFGAKSSFGTLGTFGNQQTITTFLKSIITYPMSVILLFYNYCTTVNNVKNVSMSTSTSTSTNTNIHNINMKEYTNKLIGTWYNVDVENSNLYIYQNSDIILKESQSLKFVKGYIDYDKMVIYTNTTAPDTNTTNTAYGTGTNNFFNISHLNYVNNMYTFMILFDNNSSNYSVYSKYGYVVNIDTIKKFYIFRGDD